MKSVPASHEQIAKEVLQLYLEEEDSLAEYITTLISDSLDDFPDEEDSTDPAARHAAEIMRASITDGTRSGHIRWPRFLCRALPADHGLHRITKAYITYHLRQNPKWMPKAVTKETPADICKFITKKCGPKEKGYEGHKVR